MACMDSEIGSAIDLSRVLSKIDCCIVYCMYIQYIHTLQVSRVIDPWHLVREERGTRKRELTCIGS